MYDPIGKAKTQLGGEQRVLLDMEAGLDKIQENKDIENPTDTI